MDQMENPNNETGSAMPNKSDVEEHRIIAAIGYIFILCLVPLLGRPKSEFAQFHGKQGLVLMMTWFVLWIIGWFPILGWIVLFFGNIALLILAVLGFMNALQGNYWKMPVLGKYAKKIHFQH